VRIAQDIRYERADVGVLPRRDFGLSIFCASRPLIEFVLQRRAMAITNIALRPECRVTEIVPADEAVHGVRFYSASGQLETAGGRSGRRRVRSRGVDVGVAGHPWLERPKVTEVGVDISCATAVVQIPTDAIPDWKVRWRCPIHPPWR
jgi:hypothetical protein